jgi:FkbM family methyltransferase
MSRRALRTAAHRLTRPVRNAPLPVLRGNGRGLRVRFGESTLSRTIRSAERQVEDTLLDLLHPGDVVYDIGANVGWYALLAARRTGPEGRVIAFEPGLENATLVRRNATSNGANIMVVPAAVSDRDGWAMFLNKGSLQSRLDKNDDDAQAKRRAGRRHNVKGRIPVPVVALDSWIEQTGAPLPSLVKIDVEGAEIGVLRGMSGLVGSFKPTLIVELHSTRDSVLDLLDGFGYRHEPIEVDVPSREAPWWAHILARPS